MPRKRVLDLQEECLHCLGKCVHLECLPTTVALQCCFIQAPNKVQSNDHQKNLRLTDRELLRY